MNKILLFYTPLMEYPQKYKNSFVLPFPIEVQFHIFKYEHQSLYKTVLEELLDEKCPVDSETIFVRPVLEHTHSHFRSGRDVIICKRCYYRLSKSYVSRANGELYAHDINNKFDSFKLSKNPIKHLVYLSIPDKY